MATGPAGPRERWLWIGAGVCLAAIYGTLYVVRPLANALRDRGLLQVTVLGLFTVAAAGVVAAVLRRRPGLRELAVLAGFGLLYGWLFTLLPIPEERFHLLEYGIFAVLLHGALEERRARLGSGRGGRLRGLLRSPAVLAVLATGLCGWIDELIQGLLPNRFQDPRDVVLNLLAGVLVVVGIHALRRVRGR